MTEPLITARGAYPDIPAEDYHRNPLLLPAPSLSSSGAKKLVGLKQSSALHFWFTSPMNPEQPEDIMRPWSRIGRAAHDVVLLADRWPQHYFVLPASYNANATVAQKDLHAERDAASDAGMTVLKHDESIIVQAVAAALSKNALAMALITNGVTEETLAWQDPKTQVWLRARPDFRPQSIVEGRAVMVVPDLKFVAPTHATPKGFERAIGDFGYHQSAAFYSDGIKAIYGHYPTNWVHIVVEKEAPYSVSIYELPGEDIERGRWLNRRAIDLFARCLETGVWPGPGEPKPDGSVMQVGLSIPMRMRIEDMADAGADGGAWSAAA